MRFLIILLLLVFLFKFYQIYKKYESFDGNCIKEFSPNFNDASGNSLYSALKTLYDNSDNTVDISNTIKNWLNTDLSTTDISNDIGGYMVDPMSKDYYYFDKINCKLSYLNI